MHSRDSYHYSIPAFVMEIPPRQPGTWVGCGYAGCSPRLPSQGQCSPCTCPLHQHRGQNLPAVLTLACQKGHILWHWQQPSTLWRFSMPENERSFWGGREVLSLSKEKSAQNNSLELDKNPRPSSAKPRFELPYMWNEKREIHCCKEARKRETHCILAWQLFLLLW